MKKIIVNISILLITIFFSFQVFAEGECSSSDAKRLKELAEKVELKYTYEVVQKDSIDGSKFKAMDFTIHVNNLTSELEPVIITGDKKSYVYEEFERVDDTTAKLSNVGEGKEILVSIQVAKDNVCAGKKLITKTIKLPYYNYYYDHKICIYHKDCDACNQIIEKKLNAKSFIDMINKCDKIKFSNNSDNAKSANGGKNTMNIYYFAGGGLIIVLITVIALAIIKKRKKKFI